MIGVTLACLALAALASVPVANAQLPVTQCPDSTWSLYTDNSGIEGVDSCVKQYITPSGISWNAARDACAGIRGARLLTSRQVRHFKSASRF